MDALKATGVCLGYGRGASRCDVLRGFSLTVEAGEFVALMGPSGSGKSTFLNLAAGLLVPEAGEITVGGACVSRMSDAEAARFRRRHEGVVFQDYSLLESLSVAENVTLAARLDRVRAEPARVDELLGRLGLGDRATRPIGELSGGERQRVAIARALYRRPDVVLADEPTGNLDAKAAQEICALLKELSATEKRAILLVTHDPVVAAAAGRVCFLKDGRLALSRPTGHDPAEISRLYLETYRV